MGALYVQEGIAVDMTRCPPTVVALPLTNTRLRVSSAASGSNLNFTQRLLRLLVLSTVRSPTRLTGCGNQLPTTWYQKRSCAYCVLALFKQLFVLLIRTAWT